MQSQVAPGETHAPALSVEALTYSYPHAARPALAGVSLELAPGELALLAGRSASGKSTLLRAACGLVPHFHGGEIEGRIEVAGIDALATGPGELAAAVGYVAQDPETQVVSTTVAAEIELPLEMRGDQPSARARAVEEVALALAIPHLLDRAVDTLSGGELQRVALAAALVTRPRLVLLDEPTSQLDPVAGDELIWLLRRLNEEWGVTILLAEHRLERCLAAADRVIAMASGSVAFDGEPRDFLVWAQERDPALETPAARLFSLIGIEPLPVGVRDARRVLDAAAQTPLGRVAEGGGDLRRPEAAEGRAPSLDPHHPSARSSAQDKESTPTLRQDPPAISAHDLWVELASGETPRDVLRGIDLTVGRGERVALMGRNGAGKSTLLRTAAGLADPVRGKIEIPAGIALLTQSPSDYLVRERVGDELPGEPGLAALRLVGLEHAIDVDPRDLSGGERQRLALAIVLAGHGSGGVPPGLVALDEPTRGMDRSRKADLVDLIGDLATGGAGVLVATHDVEFAAAFAERVVLLGDGVAIADGPAAEVLSGGWYFATEVARVLDLPGVITPEQGAAVLRQDEGGLMSWQLASFVILTAVLLGGFAWYERSRPPSQVVALVAALAALAIAGRIAFAAFPNVKPTTDIVLFAGYALGAAPGFAVGALAALVSNFWFGQGPWTPWQMVGWGMCGMLGAALALGVRNAGRFTLAAACGFAGIAYGVLLNFSLMATYGGDLSLERFLTLQARALPFDAAHALGNVVFALIAGPAMVRMLVRFRERFQWRVPAVATAALIALLLPALVRPAQADFGSAANWLETQQNADGGFGSSPEDDSSAAITGWAMLGLEAAGRNPFDVARADRTPVDSLRANLGEVSSAGDLARTVVALLGAGADPRSFGGRNLVEELRERRAANGSFAGWPGTTSFSVIALRAADATGGLDKTTSWLVSVQNPDGGWGDVPGQPSNADVTGSVMQALPETKAAQKGLSYLRKHQRSSGGFSLGAGGTVNTQSTAWAVQGMIAVGADPAKAGPAGRSALDYLAAQQAANGHYRYSESSDQTPIWVTGQVLVATAGDALPVPAPPREKTPKAPTTAVSPPSVVAPPSRAGAVPTPGVEESGVGVPPSTGSSPDGGIPAPPPVAEGATPFPGIPGAESPGIESESPATETGSPAAASIEGTEPASPWIAIGVGLGATLAAIAAPVLLGRRFGW